MPQHPDFPLLDGQYALVTGGTRGIGRSIAATLAGQGARVVVTSRRAADSAETAAWLQATYGSPALGLPCDVSDPRNVTDLFQRIAGWTGSVLDILVNNAGYPIEVDLWNTPLHEMSDTDLESWFLRVYRTDTLGSAYCTRQALRLMLPRRSGKILFITSTPALEGYKGTPYTAAKSALLGLMKDVAREYGRHGIRANALALGNIGTEATLAALDDTTRRALADEAPMGRWGTPDEVGRAALFLVSDLASFVTGQTLVVDGGTVRR